MATAACALPSLLASGAPPSASATSRLPQAAQPARLASLTDAVGGGVPVADAVTAGQDGAWVAETDGTVVAEAGATSYGDASRTALAAPVVDMAVSPSGQGYWLLGGDGGVLNYGDAGFHGSTGGVALRQPVLQLAPTPTGHGYWLVARDGGVFAFGDARYAGRAPTTVPAIGVLASSGSGYWVVEGDGTLAPFGGAAPIAVGAIANGGSSLVGQVVTIDPGHDGGNGSHPAQIDVPVPSGPGQTKACDTVGTTTAGGYTEHAFNFDMATRLAAELHRRGATVVLTRTNDTGVGPCVNERAAIGNVARSDAAISIHGDGGPPGGRGFTVLEPALLPGYNDAVVGPSAVLATTIANAFSAVLPPSDYDGTGGVDVRDDLGGLNLSTVPKVLIECGNMQNTTDASLEESPAWQAEATGALATGLASFLIESSG